MTNIFIYLFIRCFVKKIACLLFYICIIKIPYNAKSKMKTMNEMKHKIKSKKQTKIQKFWQRRLTLCGIFFFLCPTNLYFLIVFSISWVCL